jgi:hypothetical protein
MTSQYYRVTARVGVPHRNSVEVTIPLVGPAGPQGAAGAAGATGAQGPQGVPGTGLEVLTTQGDLPYQGASTSQRLPIGTSGQVLKVSGGIPAWANESGAVSSVAGRTGAVTLAVADVADAVATSDARLSDARAPLSHTHGNLTNAGAIGTTANLPLKTGTNGVVEAGAFGTAAGSFCEGDDARLSDDRDPNLHAASHLPDGADEIFDQDLNTDDEVQFAKVNSVLTSGDFDNLTITNGQNAILAINNPEAAAFALFTYDASDPDDPILVGQSLLGVRGTDAFLQGSSSDFRMEQSGGGLADINVANVKLKDATNDFIATIDAQDALSADVTLTIADRSGVNVVSDTGAGSGSDVVNNIVSLTTAEYAAIGSPDAATLFLITDP